MARRIFKRTARFAITLFTFLVMQKTAISQFYPVTITTMIAPPVSAQINQALSNANNTIRVTFSNNSQQDVRFRVWGKIEKLTAPNISVSVDVAAAFNLLPEIFLARGQSQTLATSDVKRAFANFNEGLLIFTPGNAQEQLREGLNYKLPAGEYRLCIMAGTTPQNLVADPNAQIGCGFFTICKLSPPQFIQPVNNLNVNAAIPTVRPTSPFAFTWLAPQGSCAIPFNDLTYNLEIREILDNQTILDAVNNPYVFRKTLLRTSTFLLDSNLYKNVLLPGKKYAIRVQAEMASLSNPLQIDNNGYSRMEAFQYGSDVDQAMAINTDNDPNSFMIDGIRNRIESLDSIFTAFQNRKISDTLIPVRDFIALQLTENGIAYNPDAVEMLLALNPALRDKKLVKLSSPCNLPDFPELSGEDRQKFDQEFETNELPDPNEEKLFRSYLDSLHLVASDQKAPANVVRIARDLEQHLTIFSKVLHEANRVSVRFVNRLLAEFLLATRGQRQNSAIGSRLQSITANIIELTTEAPGGALSLNSLSPNLKTLLCYNNPQRAPGHGLLFSFVDEPDALEAVTDRFNFIARKKQLLPFDVVIWKYSKETPPRAVYNAPDLNKVFRIMYTTPALYNERNPEINAISSSQLASTTVISLPANSAYYIWAQNMLNHQLVKPQKFDINGIFLLSNKKEWPDSKNYKIILKAN